MTATNIRIMEENTENKTFELIMKGSVYTSRSDRSAWHCATQLHGCVARRGSTGQTGGEDRSDWSPHKPKNYQC